MSLSRHRLIHTRRPSGGVAGAWWLARWLLVLLLAFDYLSAPFHLHGHDGPGDRHELAVVHGSFADGHTHAQGEDHPLLSHASMAIRVEPSRLAQRPAASAADAADAAVAAVTAVALVAAMDEPPPHWQPDRSRPRIRPHRSLPPAGRAPPVHA
jgi:hypothetical protein